MPKVDQDVKVMRDEITREDKRRDGGPGSRNRSDVGGIEEAVEEGEGEVEVEDDDSAEVDNNQVGVKVSGA